MSYSTCTPQSVYGGYRQTLFLGCSVLSFSATAGWNGSSSEVTVELAADRCASPPGYSKEYWAGHGVYVTPQYWTAADPGFTFPNVGAPVYFRVADFEYSGLIQGWTVKEGADGYPVYTVKLIDPRAILDHAQVILDKYEGGHQGLYNLFNVYGYLEGTASNCPDVTVNDVGFGAPAGGFGGSRRTDRGIPWDLIKAAMQDLAGSVGGVPSTYSQGGLFYRGTSGGGWGELNYGIHTAGAKYILDIEEVPNSYTWDYRITGPIVSLSELINQVCADAGCDYYVELLPTGTSLVIKVRTISRANQPSLGTSEITSFITANNINLGGDGIVSDSFGRELRSEINSSFLIGANGRSYFQEIDPNNMTPFWGYDAEGELIESEFSGPGNTGSSKQGWEVHLDFRKINLVLNNPVTEGIVGGKFGSVFENEMRYVLGDYETFLAKILTMEKVGGVDTVIQRYYRDTLEIKLNDVRNRDPGAMDDRVAIDGLVGREGGGNDGTPTNPKVIDGKTFFSWFQSYVQDFWGKQFLVLCPHVCSNTDTDTKKTVYSDEPSTDGGWATPNDDTDILGIDNPSIAADFFKDESGKIQPILKYTGADLNLKALNQDDYLVLGTEVWVKASVEQKWVEGTPVIGVPDDDKLAALLKIGTPVLDGESIPAIESNSKLMDAKPQGAAGVTPVVTKNKLGAQGETVGAVGAAVAYPYQAGVPVKSNTRTYGPWYAVGANPGSVHCEVDDGLAPWEYGGSEFMNAAGTAKVANAITAMQFGERGEVTIPGYPTLSLGSALLANSPNTRYDGRSLGVGSHSYPNGPAMYNFVSWSVGQQTGGASVSSINVTVGPGGVTTSYTISTFTPVFGRFSKGNAERVKQIGLNKLKGERDLRASSALSKLLKVAESRGGDTKLSRIATDDIGKGALAPRSPGIWFAGKLTSDPKRKIVIIPDKHTMPYYSEYDSTSYVSMDAIIRPVSNYGDAGLPKIASNSGNCPTFQTSAPPPPVDGYTGLPVVQKYLDYLADPVSNTTLLDGFRGNESTSGHDVEAVARESMSWLLDNQIGGTDSLLIHISGNANYAADYRHFALRGPLVIHGWGYDIYGKPVPNSVGDSAGTWQDNYENLTDKFKEDWLSDARDWPAAPVDLRFDRARGVWTIPPAFRMYQVESATGIGAGGYGTANVLKGAEDIYDKEGNVISSPTIQVFNPTDKSIVKGVAYYDTAACEYWLLGGGEGGGLSAACSDRAVPRQYTSTGVPGTAIHDPCGSIDWCACESISNVGEQHDCIRDAIEYGGYVGKSGESDCPDLNDWEFIEWGRGVQVSGVWENDPLAPTCLAGTPEESGKGRKGLLVSVEQRDIIPISCHGVDYGTGCDPALDEGAGAAGASVVPFFPAYFIDFGKGFAVTGLDSMCDGGPFSGETGRESGIGVSVIPGFGIACSNREASGCGSDEVEGGKKWEEKPTWDPVIEFFEFGKGLQISGIQDFTGGRGGSSGLLISMDSGSPGIGIACSEREASGCDQFSQSPKFDPAWEFLEFGNGIDVSGIEHGKKSGVLVSVGSQSGQGIAVACSEREATGCGQFNDTPDFSIPKAKYLNFGKGLNVKGLAGEGGSGLLISVNTSGNSGGVAVACSQRTACDSLYDAPTYCCDIFPEVADLDFTKDRAEFIEFGRNLIVSGVNTQDKTGVLVSSKIAIGCSDRELKKGCDPELPDEMTKYGVEFIEFGDGIAVSGVQEDGWSGVAISVEGTMKVGTTGCGTGWLPCASTSCLIIGTGLTWDTGTNVVAGPLISDILCDNSYVDDEWLNQPFGTLLVGTGLTLNRDISPVEQPPDPNGFPTGGCSVWLNTTHCVTGTTAGGQEIGGLFECLKFGSGFYVEEGISGHNCGAYTLHSSGIKIGATGCKSEFECKPVDCLVFGSGLTVDPITNTVSGPSVKLVAPCSGNDFGPVVPDQITFGSGLTGVFNFSTCDFQVDAPQWIRTTPCGTPASDAAGFSPLSDDEHRFFNTLDMSTGLFVSQSGCAFKITGPRYSGLGTCEADEEANRARDYGPTPFDTLVFGSGIEKAGPECAPILHAVQYISNKGCENKPTTKFNETFFRNIIISTGLNAKVVPDFPCAFEITGPDVSGMSVCDRDGMPSTPFQTLIFGSGLQVELDAPGTEGQCAATVNLVQKFRTRSGSVASPSQGIRNDVCHDGPFECIGIGTGLTMEDEGDCEALISWNGFDYRVTGCVDAVTASIVSRARSVVFGTGFGYMGQSHTPAADRLDFALTAGPQWTDHDAYLCADYAQADHQVACEVSGYKGLDVRVAEGDNVSTIFLAPNVHQFTEDSDNCKIPDGANGGALHTQMLELGVGLEKIASYSTASECKTLIAKNLTVGGIGDYIKEITFDAIGGCTTLQGTFQESCDDGKYTKMKMGTIGYKGDLPVITGIACSGDSMAVFAATLTFCNGLLQGVS